MQMKKNVDIKIIMCDPGEFQGNKVLLSSFSSKFHGIFSFSEEFMINVFVVLLKSHAYYNHYNAIKYHLLCSVIYVAHIQKLHNLEPRALQISELDGFYFL